MLPWDHLGLSVVLFVVYILHNGLSLDLRGSEVNTTQNSVDADAHLYARLAVDRDLSTFSHTGWKTREERTNPWWKVDLGGVHCLRKITLINAIHHAHRLEGNVVRAGLNSNHLLNPEIGRVAAGQTLSRAVIDFTPEPYVIAQYVSVDIHGSDPQTIVQLTEVMVEEVNTATTKQATRKGLFLTGRPSSQSSTFTDSGDMRLASRAVDGHLQYVNPHCSQTNVQESPWWMINLTAVHCIRKVAIRNIDDLHDSTRLNLMGAEVRTSLSNTPKVDEKCGSNVTQYQALINDWIEFTCDPPRLAQYVRIEIPRQTALILCEVRIWPCDLHPAALNFTEKRSYQSSTSGNSIASLALDNLPSEPYCSETVNEMNPWWKLDLETSQCVETIRIWPTAHGATLQRASLRAGLSDNHTSNVECKTSQPQPSPNDFTEFTCHPPVLARYVSVDIPGMASLGLCEVTVAACDFNRKVNSLDFTVVVNPALIGPTGDNDSVIAVYREPDDFASNVSFGRQVITGLPSGSGEIVDSSLGCTVRLLRLPEEGGLDRTGVFYAEVTKNDVITKIQSVVLPKEGTGSRVHIRPATRTLTASIGDSVTLQMHIVSSPNNHYRWRHNGGEVVESWNDRLSVSLSSITESDEGIYSCFAEGYEAMRVHGNMRLIVRGCSSGLWGPPLCLKTCRRCYSGGVCDDKSGTCVCAPGFSGDNCEQAHGRHVFGKTADQRCSSSTDAHNDACRGRLFCLPDPYGCSCAAGYQGLDCMQECEDGTFGADCQQTCHCASGGTCSKDTGECSMGCVATFFGSNCQCSTQNGVLGLEVTSGDPRQLFVSWQPDPCASGYELTTRDECDRNVFQTSIPQTTYQFITGLEPPLNYKIYIWPVYPDDVRGPVEIFIPQTRKPTGSPTEVNVTSATPYSLSFSWSKPTCGSRGGIITGYTYKLTEVSPESQAVIQSVTSQESVTIEGLLPLTEYSFQVAANTNAGTGPYSQAEVATTMKGSSSLAPVAAVVPVIVILLIIVTIMIYKRRSRQTRSDEVNDDTKHQHMNKTFETDAAYQVPEPIPEPAPYTSLGDGVVSIKTSIKKPNTKPLTSRTSKNVTAYEIPEPTFEPSVYASINDEVAVESSAASAEGRLKPKPLPTPSTLQVIAADDDAYEVTESVIYASVSDGEVEMSSEPSNASSLKPKHRPSPQKSTANGDSHEQWIQELFSRISSVSVNELADYIQRKERASQNGFPADFKTLPDGQQHPANASVQPHNKAKNQYVDAVAYDHSRVVLEPLENDPHSDYINANYIDGCLEKDKYIATQGPTESTIGDFWRMVWQLKVNKIIMLTNPVESGKDGCKQYWPDSGFTNYSNIALSIVKEDEFPDYTVRVFQINKFFSKEDNRLVTQFNFKNWPETKPPNPTSLLNFIHVANAEQSEGRTVVHCSNGIGRTGTYIALDSMLDQMQKEQQVDVLGFIYRMRQKRINMVQTPEQYRFIFDALLAASKMVDTPYENIKESTKRMK